MPALDINKKYIMTGLIMGSMSGLLGIGGGVILIPILVAYFGFAQHKAHAVSFAVVLFTAVAGATIYGLHGDIDIMIGAQLAAGGMIGAAIGANIMKRLHADTLKRMFGILLVVVGIRMLIS